MDAPDKKLTPKQKHYELIVELNKDCKFAYAEYLLAKEEAKERKSRSDRLSAHLHEFISRGPDLQQILEFLFEDSPTASAPPVAESGDSGEQPAEEASLPAAVPLCLPSDHWRLRPIAELGLTEGLNESLAKEKIRTIGELTDFWGSGKYLSEVAGIGLAHFESVTSAFQDFIERHPEIKDGMQSASSNNGAAAAPGGDLSSPTEGEAAKSNAAGTLTGAAADSEPAAAGSVVAENWVQRELAVLDIPDFCIGAMVNADLETLGDLVDYWAAEGSLLLIHGMGPKGNRLVIEAYLKYCDAHPEVMRLTVKIPGGK